MANPPPLTGHAELVREIGLPGAVLLGLGSIVGTGVFISIGIAAGVAGQAVIVAIVIAAFVASCNGLSSAQLAANFAVSGGTYEYGYRCLNPTLGFVAGWMFLCAKSASAATAALGLSGYLFNLIGIESAQWRIPAALAMVLVFTVVVLTGARRSNVTNTVIVSITLLSLGVFILGGLTCLPVGVSNIWPLFDGGPGWTDLKHLCHASALMFVAFTGYGRIATLGEEVHEPRRSIPRAIVITLLISTALYVGVAAAAIVAVGSRQFADATLTSNAPLELVARARFAAPIPLIVAVGAVTAMSGVLLNLILGLSRVWLAMGRRGDMPRRFARLNAASTSPTSAVIVSAAVIAGITCIGNIKATWSFSAFTVLVYYAITNLAALRLPTAGRYYPKWTAIVGLASCLFLAFWVEPKIWLAGLGLIAAGLMWRYVVNRNGSNPEGESV